VNKFIKLFNILSVLICLFCGSLLAQDNDEDLLYVEMLSILFRNTSSSPNLNQVCYYGYDGPISIMMNSSDDDIIFSEVNFKNKSANNCKFIYVAKKYVDKFFSIRDENGIRRKYSGLIISNYARIIEDGGDILAEIGRENFEITINKKFVEDKKILINTKIQKFTINIK